MQNDSGSAHTDTSRDLPRHTVATLAYRASKAFRGAREDFTKKWLEAFKPVLWELQ
ncbi:MAG TPA: hypothetical protein VGR84_11380 [Candidatus Acidoferrales bacterium]|nr:hypothetical protein [Candidatus Acidoferrales bacterium]